ncbi:hypothetical protein ALC57_04013, partial [Trachymyrmex cornetzi]
IKSIDRTFALKHIHFGKAVVEIANFLAICIFNGGYINILKIMEMMGVIIDKSAHDLALSRDENRLKRSEYHASTSSKDVRIANREEKAAQNDFYEAEKGVLYSPGIDH